MSVYINGVLVLTGKASYDGTTSAGFTIGDLRPNRLIPFAGNINDIMLYHRVLTDAEILQNYNATKTKYGL